MSPANSLYQPATRANNVRRLSHVAHMPADAHAASVRFGITPPILAVINRISAIYKQSAQPVRLQRA